MHALPADVGARPSQASVAGGKESFARASNYQTQHKKNKNNDLPQDFAQDRGNLPKTCFNYH